MKIVLMRHGPPDFDSSRGLHRHDLATLVAEYTSSRVTAPATPAALAFVASLDPELIVSSSMARSIDSAQALACHDALALPALDEADLPCPSWLGPPLSYRSAALVARLGWFAGYSSNAASLEATVTRARTGAANLVELARSRGTVLAVGHGIMNRLVGRELVRSGWVREARPGSGYWSVTRFRKAGV